MSDPSKGGKPPSILVKFDILIQLLLDGLATRQPLASLSEKTVTPKVRKNLKQAFKKNSVTVACRAIQKKGIWIGHGTLNGKIFTWLVLNGGSANK